MMKVFKDATYIGEMIKMVGFWMAVIVLTVIVIIGSVAILRDFYGKEKYVWAKEDDRLTERMKQERFHKSISKTVIFSEYGKQKDLPTWGNQSKKGGKV